LQGRRHIVSPRAQLVYFIELSKLYFIRLKVQDSNSVVVISTALSALHETVAFINTQNFTFNNFTISMRLCSAQERVMTASRCGESSVKTLMAPARRNATSATNPRTTRRATWVRARAGTTETGLR